MKLLVDTNVLLDFFETRQPFVEDWKRVYVMSCFRDAELWASAKSYADIFYVARKQMSSKTVQRSIVECLSLVKTCAIDGEDIRWAAEQGWKDFEDCVVSRAAQKVGADYILTRNVEGFERSAVPAITPADFLALVEEKYHLIYEEMPMAPHLKAPLT